MESVTTGQSSNLVIVLQCVDTDSTRISGIGEEIRRNSRVDVIILFVVLLTRRSSVLGDSLNGRWDGLQLVVFDCWGREAYLQDGGIDTLTIIPKLSTHVVRSR
jgi:hypothetical protein